MNDALNNAKRVAIVTGASRGIGRAIALALGGQGYRVAINYHSSAESALSCAAQVKDAGGEGMVIQADISSAQDRQRIVDDVVEAWGPVDLLVNNAGVAPKVRLDLLETDEQSMDYVLGTNLKGPFFLSQIVSRHMIANRDRYPKSVTPAIVNISSVSAYTASINRGEYCIAKSGVAMMTQLFAARLAPHNINVYEVRPGVIATDMTGPVKDKYDKMIFHGDLLPLARWGQPDDVAKAVIAVGSGLLPYSTGQVIDVDGGFHLRRL